MELNYKDEVFMGEELKPVACNIEDSRDFYFESESLALKSSDDYQILIETLVKLEAQKIKAVEDLECLESVREKALRDPLTFVTDIQNGVELKLPSPIEIVEVPSINWEKYGLGSFVSSMRPNTRKKNEPEDKIWEVPRCKTVKNTWTNEEQRILEELLIKYPDEYCQFERCRKIAAELGTRTALQVQSRVQKYFLSLKKKILPYQGTSGKFQTVQKLLQRNRNVCMNPRSSFYSAFDTYACDDERTIMDGEDPVFCNSEILDDGNVSDESDITPALRDTEEYQELMEFKRAKKLKEVEITTGVTRHMGFECDGCGANPIVGCRWHCLECPPHISVDFCQHCVASGGSWKKTEDSFHSNDHKMQPYRVLSIRDVIRVKNLPRSSNS